MTSSFAEYIDHHSPTGRSLPFAHTTRCELFSQLCASGTLNPSQCKVYGEHLLYFFYGRPAYRSNRGNLPDTRTNFLPICFLLSPTILENCIKRAYPFDTGAANMDAFIPFVASHRMADFALFPYLDQLKKAVTAFFSTNQSYFTGRADHSKQPQFPTGVNAVDDYFRLITKTGIADYDDRRSAFEIQTEMPVPLKDSLLAVILPSPFLDDPAVLNTITQIWKAEPLQYNHTWGSRPSDFATVVADKAADYLKKNGYFN